MKPATDQPPMSKSVVKRLQAQGAEPVATKPVQTCDDCRHELWLDLENRCKHLIPVEVDEMYHETRCGHKCEIPAEGGGEVELPCPPHSPSGKLWHEWFDRCGEHATLDVVNATATLVIEEKKLMDDTRTSQPAQPELRQNPRVNALLVALRKIRDNCETIHGAKDLALSAIQQFIESDAQPLPATEAPLTDTEVDAFLEEHKDDPVDEAQLERVRTMFNQKLGEQVVEDFIRSLPWSDSATEDEKTLVAGNIRGFASFLRRQPCAPLPTTEARERAEWGKVRDVLHQWYESSPSFEIYSVTEEEFESLTDRIIAVLSSIPEPNDQESGR